MIGRGRSYTHPMGDYVRKLDAHLEPEALEAAAVRLRKGEPYPKQIIFNSLLRLTLQIAAGFIHPDSDGIFSAAMEGLWVSLHEYPAAHERSEVKKDNIKAFCCLKVRQFIRAHMAMTRVICVPVTSQRAGKRVPQIECIEEGPGRLDGQLIEVELRDLVAQIVETPMDREIVAGRLDGLTDKQIGDKLGVVQSTIYKRRLVLQERLTRAS